MNEKAAKNKLLKGAKRTPFVLEENSLSSNLVFSLGAWFNTVLPSIIYWTQASGDKTCKVGDYIIKVGGAKAGKDNENKHIDTQMIFFADKDKIVCHFYNTTQRILVNGHGYKKFIDLFLNPFFNQKINLCLQEINQYNADAMVKLGCKIV